MLHRYILLLAPKIAPILCGEIREQNSVPLQNIVAETKDYSAVINFKSSAVGKSTLKLARINSAKYTLETKLS